MGSASRLLGTALALGLLGCATYDHTSTLGEYAGRTLSLRGTEGAERLRLESEYDSAIRQYVTTHGQPDYIHVPDRSHVYLFYLRDDVVASFARGLLPPSEVTKVDRMPGSMVTLLPLAERERVLARRKGQALKAARRKPPKRVAKPRRARPVPAAPAPTGITLGAFDVSAIVGRLSSPMSAADPGVSGWRRSTLADGRVARSGRLGGTRFVVLPAEVSVMTSLPGGRTRPPASARVGLVRLNKAVFGTRAASVSHAVEPLMAQVAADPSGRTRVVRRILGRTVQVSRVPAKQLLVYTVSSN